MPPKDVTMQQVADAAHVSRTTVSFVLNNRRDQNIPDTTWNRVLEAARTLGYPVRSITPSRTIAFLARRTAGHAAQAVFMMEVLQGLSQSIEQSSYGVSLHILADNEYFDYETWLRENAFNSAILFNVVTDERDQLEQLVDRADYPLVTIHPSGVPSLPSAGVDNFLAASEATRHLVSLGHRQIGAILYAPTNHIISQQRWLGFRYTLEQAGIPFNEHAVVTAGFTSESGYWAARDLLSRMSEPPTAIFVMSDMVALGAMHAFREAGFRIPQDISIIGFDDIPMAQYFCPPLTTIRQSGIDIGGAAGDLMLRLIRGEQNVPSVSMPFHLVRRDSTSAPR